MKNEEEINDRLDRLIADALQQEPELQIPVGFADSLVQDIEKSRAAREIWQEYCMKAALVAVSLAILFVLLILAGQRPLAPWIDLLARNWFILAVCTMIVVFISFFDQVVLRYLMRRNEELGIRN